MSDAPCATCGRPHVKGEWWPRHMYKASIAPKKPVLKRPTAPDRVYLVCSEDATSGSIWDNVEDAHVEACELTYSEGVKWGVFAYSLASPLPLLRIK